MKLKVYALFIALILALNLNAQPFYIKAGLGLGFQYNQTPQGSYFPTLVSNTVSYDNIRPMGTGLNYNIELGCFLYKYIGVDLSIEYLSPGYENSEYISHGDFYPYEETVQFNGKVGMVFLLPG